MRKYTYLILILCLFSAQCSSLRGEEQFTNKVVASSFVSELYGTTTQTITINHNEASEISWMGFIQSNNYKYFKITKVQAGSTTIVEDGQSIDGTEYVANSNALIQNFSVNASSSNSSGFANGSINTGSEGALRVTIQYSPLQAIEAEENPHEAYLIVSYKSPRPGSMRVRLRGFTQGVKDEKCTQAVSTMELFEYKVKNSAFDLFFCSAQVPRFDQSNTPTDSSDPGYHGRNTNVASISLPRDTIQFYKVDEETVCLLSEPEPSIPDFVLPIPDGLAPIETMDISMVEGSFAECSLDADGNIYCDESVLIDALVSLSGFTLSNGTFTAEDLVTDDCPDFGPIAGSGAFGDSEMSLILTGRTLSDQNTEDYNIVDSLIVAEIELEL